MPGTSTILDSSRLRNKNSSYCDTYQDHRKVQWYLDEYSKGSTSSTLSMVESYHLLAAIRDFQPLHEDAVALDFACGTGRILKMLTGHVRRLIGIDISPLMAEHARHAAPQAEIAVGDILEDPTICPADLDIVTCFRFLLFAEPSVAESCIKVLTAQLRDSNAIMVFGLHGNPVSITAFADFRDFLLDRKKFRRRFSLKDMSKFCRKIPLRIVRVRGVGFVPSVMKRVLPNRFVVGLEFLMSQIPVIRRFGKHLVVVCKPESS